MVITLVSIYFSHSSQMVDMAESDSANTIICGKGLLVRQIFRTKRQYGILTKKSRLPFFHTQKIFKISHVCKKRKPAKTGFPYYKRYSSSFISPSFTHPSLRIKKSNKRDNTAGRIKQTRIRPTQLSTVTSYG